jgi:flagellar basal body rod protein FlgC
MMKPKELKGLINGLARRVASGATTAAAAAKAVPETITGAVQDGVEIVGDKVQDARTAFANAISTTGNAAGVTVIVVGEVALFSAGVVPLLVFGELPIKLGDNLAKKIESVAKFVRGDKAQFMAVNHISGIPFISDDDVLAIIYDPHMPHQDDGGYIQIPEEEIVRQLRIMTHTHEERLKGYTAALIAVQEAKKQLKIPLKTPDIRFLPEAEQLQRHLNGPA